mgnify:CR=1 FL=1
MEQIYTIPVNEAFEASRDDASCGCPMCAIYRKLEENELDLILGASMMEPDVRIRTNELGFCKIHYDMMFRRKNRLGMALTLESHLNDLREETEIGGGLANLLGNVASKPLSRIEKLEDTCYVCGRIDFNFKHMVETVIGLWDTDEDFRPKLLAQPYFCLPHYSRMLKYAQKKLDKKSYAEFEKDALSIQDAYLEKLGEDVSWFCKKFDYRYDEEPWYNSKDSVQRAIKPCRSL